MKTSNSRREFIKASSLLAIGFSLPSWGGAKSEIRNISDISNAALGLGPGLELSPYVVIDDLGKIILYNAKPDVGQGTWQAIPMLLAEELEVSMEQIEIRMTDGTAKYGAQNIGGSNSIRSRWKPMRQAGAAAKEMLIKAASNQWQVPVNECFAKEAKVYHKPTNKSLSYAALIAEASKLEVPKNPTLKDPKDFKLLGKSLPRPEIPSKTNGKAVFGIDATLPKMLYATIEMPPAIYGKVGSFDGAEAMKVKGVKYVLKTERKLAHAIPEAVAVVADNYWAALKGRKALKINWNEEGVEKLSTDKYFEKLRALGKEDGLIYPDNSKGDFAKTYTESSKKLESVYETSHMAHSPLEPVTATAWVQGEKVEIWASVQSIDGVVKQVSEYFKFKPENVKVNALFLGGAFGRKSNLDFVMQAVHIAKQVSEPIKLIWTREDDIKQGPFRPAMLSVMQGSLDENNTLSGLNHKQVGDAILRQAAKMDFKTKPDFVNIESVGFKGSPYDIPNRRNSSILAEAPVPIHWWRAPSACHNVFPQESFIDEMAHLAGADPMDFRLKMLEKEPRMLKVLQELGVKSDYKNVKSGQSIGISMAQLYGTYIAQAVTVSKKGNGVKIEKVVSVVDCGLTINPDNVKAQTQGNVIMGISTAIKNGITFVDGKVQQNNFYDYQILRISEGGFPIEVHVMESFENPGGIGEAGLPPIAPALTNAIFRLTGKRIKSLPFDMDSIG
jgi:isoquinoline 1-oxidoreductase subunit beta